MASSSEDNNSKKIDITPNEPLTFSILDSWRREFDCLPYKTLVIHRRFFEKRMGRSFNDEDFSTLVDYLKRRAVTHIGIFNISLPKTGDVSEFVDELLLMEVVDLVSVELPDELLLEMAKKAVKSCIKVLRLNGNKLSWLHLSYLRLFITVTKRSIQYLDLEGCNLNQSKLEFLTNAIYINEPIAGLSVGKMDLRCATGAHADVPMTFPPIVSNMRRMVELHFRNCNLDCSSIGRVIEVLLHNKQLIFLDLSFNNIGKDGAERVMKALTHSDSLIGLDLSHNNLGTEGAQMLAKYVATTKMRYLNIAYNKIGKHGTHFIASSLSKSGGYCKLHVLNIYGNEYSDDFAELIEFMSEKKIIYSCNFDAMTIFHPETKELEVREHFVKPCDIEKFPPNCVLPQWMHANNVNWTGEVENDRALVCEGSILRCIMSKFSRLFYINEQKTVCEFGCKSVVCHSFKFN